MRAVSKMAQNETLVVHGAFVQLRFAAATSPSVT
jgi:hypothetical protein